MLFKIYSEFFCFVPALRQVDAMPVAAAQFGPFVMLFSDLF